MKGIKRHIREATSHKRIRKSKTRRIRSAVKTRRKAQRCVEWVRDPKTGLFYNPTTHTARP